MPNSTISFSISLCGGSNADHCAPRVSAFAVVVSTVVEIDSLAQLSRLMEKLEAVKDVHTVAREAS